MFNPGPHVFTFLYIGVEKHAIRSDTHREAVWGIVVLVDADEHEMIGKAVEEWSEENGNPIPIRVRQGQFIGGMNMAGSSCS